MNREDFESVMQNVCDICHRPFQSIDDEELESLFCSRCPVEKVLMEFLDDDAVSEIPVLEADLVHFNEEN